MVMDQDFFPLSIDIQFVMIHLNQAEQKTRVRSEYFLLVCESDKYITILQNNTHLITL